MLDGALVVPGGGGEEGGGERQGGLPQSLLRDQGALARRDVDPLQAPDVLFARLPPPLTPFLSAEITPPPVCQVVLTSGRQHRVGSR